MRRRETKRTPHNTRSREQNNKIFHQNGYTIIQISNYNAHKHPYAILKFE